MRNQLRSSLICYFRSELLRTRHTLDISQEEMAHVLAMSVRNYTDLEGGKTCCGLITLLLFLRWCCTDPYAFLDGLLALLDPSLNN